MTQEKLLALIKSFMDKTTYQLAEAALQKALDEFETDVYERGYDAGNWDREH